MTAPASFSQMRVVRGPSFVNNAPCQSGVQYNVGDLLIVMSGNVLPVNQFPWNSGAEIQNWSGARSEFLGVSLSQWDSTNVRSGSIRYAADGIAKYPLPSASGTTYQIGTPVSFTQDGCNGVAGSGYFQNQCLMQCSGLSTAIGTLVEQVTPSVSGGGTFLVSFQSYRQFGGLQA